MQLLQDLRYSIRRLAKSLGFTTVAVITLALGIGANTAIFSVIDAVMLKMLPVKNPQELLLLEWSRPSSGRGITFSGYNRHQISSSFSYPLFQEFRMHTEIFSDVVGYAPLRKLSINIDGQPSVAEGDGVSENYFSGLGVVPIVGRSITDQDARPDSPSVAVISHRYWTRQFGRDSSAVGKLWLAAFLAKKVRSAIDSSFGTRRMRSSVSSRMRSTAIYDKSLHQPFFSHTPRRRWNWVASTSRCGVQAIRRP